jgi:hypothetical protein
MIESADLARVLLAESRIQPLAALAETNFKLPKFTPGEQLQARVDARLADGSFRINIAGQALQVLLPQDVAAGETLHLTYVSSSPTLTFALATAPRDAAAAAELSPTARFIDSVLGHGAGVPALAGMRPLANAQPEAPQLAQALQQTVEQSGLFYEAHLAQWLSGERSLQSVLQEPQAQLGPRDMPPTAQAHDTPGSQPLPAPQLLSRPPVQPQAAPALAPPADSLRPQTPAQLAYRETAAAGMRAELTAGHAVAGSEVSEQALRSGALDTAVAPQSLALVRNQLEVLDTRQFAWHGEAWPGQLLYWHVAEQQGEPERGETPPQAWQTDMRLTLPQLGAVSAELSLGASGIRLALNAQEPHVAELMRGKLPELAHALQAAGLNVLGLQMQCREAV